jgi:hypothetical protein
MKSKGVIMLIIGTIVDVNNDILPIMYDYTMSGSKHKRSNFKFL